MKYALTNCNVYTPETVITGGSVLVDGDRIVEVLDSGKLPGGVDIIDLEGQVLAPGFIDLQVNGGGGVLFNDDPTPSALATISAAHRTFGTTGFLPTVITTALDVMLEAIDAARESMREGRDGVLGVHLEGPYISMAKRGVHDPEYVRSITDDELNLILERGRGIVRMITLAPEVVDARHVGRLSKEGILVAAGHTAATYEQAMEFAASGGTLLTHLFNAMSQFTGREPGVAGAAFDCPLLCGGIIADGFHVHFASVRTAWRLMTGRLFLVTDAVTPLGTDISSFTIGGQVAKVANGACRAAEGVLAGSVLDMATAVRNCVEHAGIPLGTALQMASTIPAAVLGSDGVLGRIEPGSMADMVVLDAGLNAVATVSRGEYRRPGGR